MKFVAWILIAVATLGFGAAIGYGPKPLVTAENPRTPNFAFGPIPGSLTQSVAFQGGPLESISIWTRSSGSQPQLAEFHLTRLSDGHHIRSARFDAHPGTDLQPTAIRFEPIDLSFGSLGLQIVVPQASQAEIYVGATLHDAYRGGELVDDSGQKTPGVDLAFRASGKAGTFTRLQVQAQNAPLWLAVGITAALFLGVLAGTVAWSSLHGERFRRPVALAVSVSVVAAMILALLHGPDGLA